MSASQDEVQIVLDAGDGLVLLRSTDLGTTWEEPFVWPVPLVSAPQVVSSDHGIHLVYRQPPEERGEGVLAYAHVDLGLDPPPIMWRRFPAL